MIHDRTDSSQHTAEFRDTLSIVNQAWEEGYARGYTEGWCDRADEAKRREFWMILLVIVSVVLALGVAFTVGRWFL